MSEPVIIVKSQGRVVGRCDEACYDAITGKCRCCCGGANHGVGLAKAIKHTKNLYDAMIALNVSERLADLEIIRLRVAPRLFVEAGK